MDFFKIKERSQKKGVVEIYPDFRVCRSKDLMVRAREFYSIWDEDKGLWSTDEFDVQRLVDSELYKYYEKRKDTTEDDLHVKYMDNFSSGSWRQFKSYIQNLSNNYKQLDYNLTWQNTEVKKTDYVSKRLPYSLEEGSIEAWDALVGTLYEPEERAKIEWAIGAIVAGEARTIHKFIVFYGAKGTGKSTIITVIQKLFSGYYATFDAKSLASSNNAFSTEAFKMNPIVGIQHDGDLSRIEDNTKINSITAHEEMTINEKFKPTYTAAIDTFLFMGTNKPVKITDSKSGIIRRLIDVAPSGNRIPPKKYHTYVNMIDFELGAIATHCLEVYRNMGRDYYAEYEPVRMMLQTDPFYNFIEWNLDVFLKEDGISLSRAYSMYKEYCTDANVEYPIARHKFREELKSYFGKFDERTRINDTSVRSYYSDFLGGGMSRTEKSEEKPNSLVLNHDESILDELLADCPAQYGNEAGTPNKSWSKTNTLLKDLDSTKLHYVKPPGNHIVIDFDLTDDEGNKSTSKNLEEASKWPATYAEFSKSGHGVHLHYIYTADTSALSRVYSPGIEIKVFTGDASLRRRLSKCNNVPIASISSGLPTREKKVINADSVKNEKNLRELIERNIRKEIHDSTKPSMDFIKKILDDAYDSGIPYDLTDLKSRLTAFAANSSHQSSYCLSLISKLKLKSESEKDDLKPDDKKKLAFFDVEVFPNLFVICWKYQGKDSPKVHMINPSPSEVEKLFDLNLVGFYCRKYDNHILYARYLGYSNEQLFELSKKLIHEDRMHGFPEAYHISYTDVYDYSNVKMSLKKFEIELGIHHQELGLKWDEPVPDDMVDLVVEYCDNDVEATEAVHEARKGDFMARKILAELSGLTVNATTQQHAGKIIFGNDKHPQDKFIYTDLSELFPGYKYEFGKSTYRDETTGEGGYVYAEPGMHTNVALLDVASMHPTSIEQLNLFGPYTSKFSDIKAARLAIKHGDYETAKGMLGGILGPYLEDEGVAADLAYALKIVINIVYGLTSAKFDNLFKDPRNVDNIVAKRGALFMIELKHEVQKRGYTVAHIKTDSIKIPNADKEIIDFVTEFGKKYGYTFEHEATYSKMCLVNEAVYIAQYGWTPKGKHIGEWTPTGAQFAEPYVFKTLFSKEEITPGDLTQSKSVTTALYLDMNEDLEEGDHNYKFVGRVGRFSPVKPGTGGGILLREKEGKYSAATGTKGYRWMEYEVIEKLGKQDDIDHSYFNSLVDSAVSTISKYGDFEWFVS